MKKFITSILILSSLVSFGQSSTIADLWKLYNSQDFKSVVERAKPMLENEPNNLDLNLMLGRSYADQADYQAAIPFLDFTVKNDKNNLWLKAWALGYLGKCNFMLEKYDDSEKSLNECIQLNATKNATNDAYGQSLLFGYNEFYKNWKIVETDHFRFHFQNMNEVEIEKYSSLREKGYKQINDFF